MTRKPRSLKVFAATIGFSDVTVAASSRKAALEAFGVRQDLFREGVAWESSDADARAAALARPMTVLSRPAGSAEPFGEPVERGRSPPVARASPRPRAKPARSASAAARHDDEARRADRAVEDLETRLRAETERYARVLSELARERTERLSRLKSELKAARDARRRAAGGRAPRGPSDRSG